VIERVAARISLQGIDARESHEPQFGQKKRDVILRTRTKDEWSKGGNNKKTDYSIV